MTFLGITIAGNGFILGVMLGSLVLGVWALVAPWPDPRSTRCESRDLTNAECTAVGAKP